MIHLDTDTLARHLEAELDGEERTDVIRHLSTCQECQDHHDSLRAFVRRLDTDWLAHQVRAHLPPDLHCPSPAELSDYFLSESTPEQAEAIGAHARNCRPCGEALATMEAGARSLVEADPLRPAPSRLPARPWGERLRAWAENLVPTPRWVWLAPSFAVAFLAGIVFAPILRIEVGSRPAPSQVVQIPAPPWTGSVEPSRLGIAPAVNPEADARFRTAMAFYGSADFPSKALPELREAVRIDPQHDEAQFWLGAALLLEGDVASAIPPLEAARRLAPARAEYGRYLAWAYLRSGQTAKALELQTELLRVR